jgi:hypothetical protein
MSVFTFAISVVEGRLVLKRVLAADPRSLAGTSGVGSCLRESD